MLRSTKPESPATLDTFYTRARPGGAWGPVRARTGLVPRQRLREDLLRVAAGVAALMGANLAIGGSLVQRWSVAIPWALISVIGIVILRRHREIY